MKPKFTICLIARNESKTLPHLVASLEEYKKQGGEIIVLDTGSTDNTGIVAKNLGCRLFTVGDMFLTTVDKELADKVNNNFIIDGESPLLKEGDKLFDFASARNFVAEKSETDWVWMPDCDEVFSNFDLKEINNAISDKNVNRLEYEFIFSHDIYGNPAIRFMHSKMYRKSSLEWKGIVHEVLSLKSPEKEGRSSYLSQDKVLLEHYQNVETNRSGYLRGLALDCFLHPDSDRNSHYLGREMLWTRRPKSAIKELERHIAMNKWPTEASQSMVYIGDAHKMLKEDPTQYYEKAFEMDSSRREPLIRLAEYYAESDNHEKVIEYMEKALQISRSSFYADFEEHYTYRPHELLYKAYWYSGNKEKSKENYDMAFSYKPLDSTILHDREFYYDLPTVTFVIPHIEGDREEGLKRCLNSIKNLNYPQSLIETLVITGDHTVSFKVKEGVNLSTGDYIVYASNDIEFMSNSLILAVIDNKDVVAFNTGVLYPDSGNICEHFLVRKSFIYDKLDGEIFDTDFHHVGVDNLLWAKASKRGTVKHSRDAVVHHHHFTRGAEMDKTYEKGWNKENVIHDRALLKIKLKQI